MRTPSIGHLAAFALIALAVPSVAAAAPVSGSVSAGATGGAVAPRFGAAGKRFRLHVGTDVFSLVHFNPDGAGNDFNTTRLGFGIGRPTLLDTPTGAVGFGVVSVGFGAVVLDGHGVVGGRLAFTVDGLNVGDDGGTALEGRFVPYFNYLFTPKGRFTPFIGPHLGLGGGLFTVTDESLVNPGEEVRITTNVIYPVVGVQGGAHIFLVDAVSIDAMVNFDYMAPFARTAIDGDTGADVGGDDLDKVGDVINVAFVSLGLSGWF